MVGLAFALSFVKVFQMPQGGSVTAGSMIPLLILAIRHGPGLGITAGVAYGLLEAIQDSYVVHPAQFLLDYPVAFGLLGAAGWFGRLPAVGSAVGIAGRFAAHFLSGVIFFAQYAPEGVSPWAYSAVYNGSYLLPELVISTVVVFILARTLLARLPAPSPGASPGASGGAEA